MGRGSLRKIDFFVPVLFCCFALSLLVSCVAKSTISSHQVGITELQPATYRVIRYRNLAEDYLTTVAFLDLEGDSFTLEPQGASYNYSVSNGMGVGEALELAEDFLRSQPSYNRTEVKAIVDPAGNLLGYEVRPLYQVFVYGDANVLDIAYFLRKENRIEVSIRLTEQMHKLLFYDNWR